MNAATPTVAIKMKLLLLDTETNGLPANKNAPASDWRHYPAVLQLSWLIYEPGSSGGLGPPVARRDISVRLPEEDVWNTGAAAIHGITEEAARSPSAALPAAAFAELYAVLRSVDIVCAHNLAFDRAILRAAAYAAADRGGPPELRTLWPAGIKELCTMNATRDILQLPPGPQGTRWKAPRLGEVYTWLYGHPYDVSGAVLHSARSDTHCLSQVVSGLLKKRLIACGADAS